MKKSIRQPAWLISLGFLILILVGCASNASTPTDLPATDLPATDAPTAVQKPAGSPVATLLELVSDSNVLYQDDFTNPATKWPEELYDNFYIGYHQSTYYHIQLSSPHFKTSVFVPGKPTYGDVTINLKVLTEVAKEGDFRYGLTFRRSGDLYYAFVISPITKTWYVLKSSSDAVTTLIEGTDSSIQDVGGEDRLRVDAKGGTFSLYINDKPVGEVKDPDYASGEVGMFVQTLDSSATHIHFDELTILNLGTELLQTGWQYRDDFTNPNSGWPRAKNDNYFISYHQPDYLQLQILIPNFKKTVSIPGNLIYGDATIDLKVLTEIAWAPGDFRYGLTFRQSGDQYYAFVISPVTKKWYVLKSSSDAMKTLKEGTADSIQGKGISNLLRVDAKGDTFTFHINSLLVGEISDPDYASGEVGLFAQTMDSTGAHIHFDELTIWDFQTPALDTTSPLGKENCTNGLDDDGDNLIDLADSDCAKMPIVTDHHNGAMGPVNDSNCAKCHSLPWAPSFQPSSSKGSGGGNQNEKPDGHPNTCGPCHAPQSSTTVLLPSNNSTDPQPPASPSDYHKGANGTNCAACHPGNGVVVCLDQNAINYKLGGVCEYNLPVSVTPQLLPPPVTDTPVSSPSDTPIPSPSDTPIPPPSDTPVPPPPPPPSCNPNPHPSRGDCATCHPPIPQCP